MKSAGVILRAAGETLHTTLRADDRNWADLPLDEQAWWGLHAAPVVLTTLIGTEPEGWERLFSEIKDMTDAWVRAGTLNTVPNQIRTRP